MHLFVLLICLPFIPWAGYQWMRGEVYTHTGRTKFSPVAWIAREASPFKFWSTIATQFAAGIILSSLVIFDYLREVG